MSKEKGSFFKTKIKTEIYNFYFTMVGVLTSVNLTVLIMGIVIAAIEYGTPILLYMYPIFLLVFFILYLLPGPKYYRKIEKLLDEGNEEELTRIAEQLQSKTIIALCALFELNPKKVKPILEKYQIEGMKNKTDFILRKFLTKAVYEMEKQERSEIHNSFKQKIAIEITKVYYIGSRKELTKGMISKIQLTLESEIVICPYCINMARKELLEKWLKEKESCPNCFSKLTIDDCPVVDIKDH